MIRLVYIVSNNNANFPYKAVYITNGEKVGEKPFRTRQEIVDEAVKSNCSIIDQVWINSQSKRKR